MPPKITSETVSEAEVGSVEGGDFVQWERDGAAVRGVLHRVIEQIPERVGERRGIGAYFERLGRLDPAWAPG